ncbi:cell division protein ZapC [uncultured Tolumonas sp.]|jgi:cell division protein ZapC|uniref:cell division protein ZapC n=1 Tax=uncultured Tolumonas sp. TaxID=263765 RepID=UPI002931A4DE|nr:cell division protein ZapC [uncultured Tolumonas sp.]
MILVPDENWRWIFDEQRQNILLDLTDDMQFTAAIPAKQLEKKSAFTESFTVDDSSHYFHFLECLGEFPFTDPERVQIVLNAIAAIKYARPLVSQSWFYQDVNMLSDIPELGEVFSVVTECMYGDVMVISPGSTASLCIVISQSIQLDSDKSLKQSAICKLMNSKLLPYQAATKYLAKMA